MGRNDLLPGESFVHILICVSISIFFIIGLPLWLVGCDPNVPNGCITRSLEDGNVTGVSIQSGICCSSCKCGKSTCCCGGYSCYNTRIGVDTSLGYCQSDVGGVFRNSIDAQRAGEAIGNKTRVVIDPRTQVCSIDLSSSLSQWIAGMFFMCLTACCCLCWFVYCCTAAVEAGCPCCVDLYASCNCCDDISCPRFPWMSRQNTRFHTTMRQGTQRIMNIRRKSTGGNTETTDNNNNTNTNNPEKFVELQETTTSSDLPITDAAHNPNNIASSSSIDVTVDVDAPPPYSEGEGTGGKIDPDSGLEEIDRKPTTL